MPPAADVVRVRRRFVLLVALLMFAAKVAVAASTYGTRDINHWHDFVEAVAAHGPVGIYGVQFASSFYNHPPLVGYLLEAVHMGTEHGITVQFSIRALAALADVGSALIVFELVRRRRGLSEATIAGALVGASPVLFVVSGYHGNTDPIFMFLVLAGLYLIADLDRPGLAGAAVALALGIKIVPVVVVPALLVLAWRRGRRSLLEFTLAGALTLAVTWLPALIGQGAAVRRDVLEYAGANVPQWGLIQIGHWFGDPGWAGFLADSGRFPVVLLCALAPAALVWWREERVAEAVALALIAFLFLSPAFGSQYTAWAIAPAYLLGVRWASVYNLAGGALMIEVYTRWNHGLPWDYADEWGFDRAEVVGFFVLWIVLGAVLVDGIRLVLADREVPMGVRASGSSIRPNATVPE